MHPPNCTLYPKAMNINCRAAVAYRKMIIELRMRTIGSSKADKTLTGGVRKTVDEMSRDLEAIANKGSSPDKRFDSDHKVTAVVRTLSKRERKKLAEKWQSGETVITPGKKYGVRFFQRGNDTFKTITKRKQGVEPPPTEVTCSKCFKRTPFIQATQGTKLRKTVNDVIVEQSDGLPPTVETVMIHFSQYNWYCPDCCLEVKPTMDRDEDGNILTLGGVPVIKRSNQRWPITEG